VDSYEFNKIAGWVLAAMVAVLGISILTSSLFSVEYPETTAYEVQGVEEEGGAGGAAAAEKPIAAFLQAADPARGEVQFRKCAACHTIDKGGATGIGPNLYGIIGSEHAHIPGFAYSAAMEETKGKTWDWESLSKWIENPRAYIPGNKMSFAGIGKPEDRANLLAYLNTKSDSPQPLPEPPAEEAPAAEGDTAAAVEGEAAAEGVEAAVPEESATNAEAGPAV